METQHYLSVENNQNENVKKGFSTSEIFIYFNWLKALHGFVLVALFCALIFIFLDYNNPQWRSLYIVLIVAISWVVGYTDIVVIGFYPLILGPVLGLASFESLVPNYISTTIILFVTATILGTAIKKVGLAKRFAIFMMKGSSLQTYDLSWRFYLVGTIISMWVADTASMTLIIPILSQMLILVREYNEVLRVNSATDPRIFKPPQSKMTHRQMEVVLTLSLAYGTCTGGMMTMIGSGSNFAFLSQWEQDFGDGTPINFTNWMVYGIPMGFLTVFAAWLAITISWDGPKFTLQLFIYFCKKIKYAIQRKDPNENVIGIDLFYEKTNNAFGKLPPMSFSEKVISLHFALTLILLFFRNPGIPGFTGWDGLFPGLTHDAMTTTLCGILIFIYPLYSYGEVHKMLKNDPNPTLQKRKALLSTRLLAWNEAQEFIQWGVLVIFGGGTSMANMMVNTGLVNLFADGVATFFQEFSEPIIVIFTLIIGSLLTEFMSAVVLLQILSPVLNRVSISLQMNPVLLSWNAVFATVNGAVTPIATTSQILACKTANLTFPELLRTGLLFKIFAIIVQYFCIYTYGYYFLDLGTFPDWAKANF